MNRLSSVSTSQNHYPQRERLESTTDIATLAGPSSSIPAALPNSPFNPNTNSGGDGSPLTDDTLLACLRERFMTDHIYTAAGSNALVVMNPHKYVGVNADSVLFRYAAEFRDLSIEDGLLAGGGALGQGQGGAGGSKGGRLPPHIFQLANNAYYHMRRTGQDQCILFTGETASGKSEARRLAIKSLLTLSVSAPGKKGSKLAAQVPASEFVLESFGNARTLFNPNASRFGKYTELQFTGNSSQGKKGGRLCGVKTLDYYLERGRVAQVPSGERNFHIFYYLVAGASPEERAHLHLGEVGKVHFRYLPGQTGLGAHRLGGNGAHGVMGGGHALPARDEDAERFDQLKIALKTIGFSKRHVAQTCQLVAAILHLGNLEFVIDRHRNEDAAVVRNVDTLAVVADFLGVSTSALENALSYKTKLVKKELCTVFLDCEGAEGNRDDLAKTLYSLLFGWLNEHVNQRLCKEDVAGGPGGAGADAAFESFIGLFDLPGPQNMSSRPNSLDQFVVNYANERLQGFVRRRIFEEHLAQEYNFEGISAYLPPPSQLGFVNDNTETLRLLHTYPGGLVHIMDDQARRQPKKTDGSMVEAFQKRWGNHTSFKTSGLLEGGGGKAGVAHSSGYGASFTISHFSGPVTYSAEGFLERNLDSVNPDFVSLLRGAEHAGQVNAANATVPQDGMGSINPFVKGLFSSKAIATQAHPRNEDTIVAAQQAVKPMRAPSTRRRGTVRRSMRDGGATSGAGVMEGIEEKEDEDEAGAGGPFGIGGTTTNPAGKDAGSTPCVAGEFKSALDTLFDTLDETQPWFVFCINPNDSQLPNQLEGRSVKGQIRASGLASVARRNGIAVFEVNMTYAEFVGRYKVILEEVGVTEGGERERVEQVRRIVAANAAAATGSSTSPDSLEESRDVVLGRNKVWLSQRTFRALEDRLRVKEGGEKDRSGAIGGASGRLRDAEMDLGFDSRGIAGSLDPYAPHRSPNEQGVDYLGHQGGDLGTPGWGTTFDNYNGSSQQLPLVANASPFQRADMYEDELYDADGKSEDTHEGGPYHRGGGGRYGTSRGGAETDSMSNFGSESYAPSRNMFQNTDKRGLMEKEAALAGELLAGDTASGVAPGETTEVLKESSARRRWVAFTWLLTWWVPTPLLVWVGRMKRMDVRQAWREKLALNLIIWFICGCTVFVIAVLGNLICPTEHVFGATELASHSATLNPNNVFTAIRGEVFDLTTIASLHQRAVPVVSLKAILKYGGVSADNIFPVQVSALCNGVTGSVSPYVVLDSKNNTDPNSRYHDFRSFTEDARPDWYFEKMIQMRYTARVGFLGFTPKEIRNMARVGRSVAIYNGLVYDLTTYLASPPALRSPDGTQAPAGIDVNFIDGSVLELFKLKAGTDITKALNGLRIDRDLLARQKVCLRNLFTVGKVDNRQSPQCKFATYILLVLSIIMVSIIGFKFLASINFGASRAPEDHDKFVVCLVPCYTEGDTSLRRTIDSLAQLKYDDKRKLLLIICDGMIVGSGNDRPTPRIVLDILGADPNLDPEPLSFVSLGEGAKQHNMGKVYSGLYECSGHVVPYLVVAKIGKPTERSRPGNRGKRDSQMLLMHFLNKVHFNSAMNPLELEMYHQIKNVIGVNPSFYEYVFMVDADTTVDPLSVNRLISAMIHDKKLLGVCGETSLANAKQSLITMMQVYEYFISHHMAKAFESLFGSVTCLPGCFTLYRLRTPDTHKPLLISNQLIHDYSENRVDTLHMKNLLHLGEDRYLTTLLLKHFPTFKTQFIRDAHAFTVAPDDWQVLLSQRRRWINSTVHNLGELIFLEQLCGFCCFSMRFVVMIDLLSTVTQPVTVAYIVYLIYLVAGEGKTIPTLSLIMIAAIYGVQALVFVMRRKWDMIGWMLFYILAIPAFSFFLPLYSFWKMDDFSWGQTRVVMGESGKKVIVHDEGKFDPRAIPLKTWSDYENELWDKESNHSIGSWGGPTKNKEAYAESRTASLYGRETYYEPQRSYSPAPSQLGMMHPPPGYQSGRNTPQSFSRQMNDAGLLYQPSPSRPTTNYLDMPIPSSRSADGFGLSPLSGGPSDADLDRAVQDILRTADLNSITKREVRRALEEHFGMDLTSRKATINVSIDRILLNQA